MLTGKKTPCSCPVTLCLCWSTKSPIIQVEHKTFHYSLSPCNQAGMWECGQYKKLAFYLCRNLIVHLPEEPGEGSAKDKTPNWWAPWFRSCRVTDVQEWFGTWDTHLSAGDGHGPGPVESLMCRFGTWDTHLSAGDGWSCGCWAVSSACLSVQPSPGLWALHLPAGHTWAAQQWQWSHSSGGRQEGDGHDNNTVVAEPCLALLGRSPP